MLNDTLVSCCYNDNSFKIHKQNGKYLKSIYYHSSIVSTIVSSPKYLFTGSLDAQIVCWEFHNRNTILKLVNTYLGHQRPIAQISPLESFCVLASIDIEGCILIHESRTGECIRVLERSAKGLLACEFGFFMWYSAD